jgi:hypothetical protein
VEALLGEKVHGAVITANGAHRGVINIEKVLMGHLVHAVEIGMSIQLPLLCNFSLLA